MNSENINNVRGGTNTSKHQIDTKKKWGDKLEKLHPETKEKIKAEADDKPAETQRLQDISKNEFHFLPDDPVTEDEFGSHRLVADSIANKIATDDSGITIGLEGTWGSGKSSVILMLEEGWKKRDDIQVFAFDAWAHQGDPLKRAFLEELISNLQDDSNKKESWLTKHPDECGQEYEKCERCEKKTQCRPDIIRQELRLRHEHNVIESEPTITNWGKLFAVCTLAMPIGVALLAASPKPGSYYFWIGTSFAASPLIVIMLCFIWHWRKKAGSGLLAEFVGKTKEVTKYTTHRGVDPTSIEFREYYWEVLRLALETKKRKLVIVVDNLDRVESETALAIWGTMHTFLEGHNSQEDEIAKRIWLIVPYDPTSIIKLWGDDSDERDKPTGLAQRFKEKTFQVRYSVPQPLTSRWEDYFKKRLAEAFPGQEPDTHHSIYHIFRIQALPAYRRQLPTPREMKLFINRMVALAHQHFRDVSLEEIALYVATELLKPEMLENLVGYQPEYEKYFADFVGKDWKYGLSAIHFGVSRQDAGEVLYEPTIRLYLSKGKSDELKELLQNPGAENCCETFLQNMSKVMNSKELLTASAAFASYNPRNSSRYIKKSIKYIADRIPTLGDKDFKFDGILNEKNARDVIRLMEFQPSICPVVRDKLSIRVTEEEIKETANILDDKMSSWVKATVQIVQYLASRNGFDSTLRLIMPNSETYLKILNLVVAEPSGKEVLKFFCPADRVSQSYLNDYLAKIEQGEITVTDMDIVCEILQMNCWKPENVEEVASSIQTAMKPNLAHDRTEYAFRILYIQRNNTVFEQKLKDIAENGRVFELLHQHHGQTSCAAFCLGTIFMYHPAPKFEPGHAATNGQQKYHELLKAPDVNIPQNIAKYCIEFDWLEDINKSVQDTDSANSEFMRAVLWNLVKQDANNDYLTTDRFISCHSLIYSHLENEVDLYEVLVGQLLRKKDKSLLSVLEDHRTDIEFGHAYHIALNDKDLDTSSLANKLCQELKTSLDENQWLEQLKNEDWMLDIVIELVNQGYKPNLDNKFVDALIEHARLLLDGEAEVESLEKSWAQLLDGLSAAEREQFRRQLPDVMSDVRKPVLDLVALYGDELQIAIQKADKRIKKRFISQVCMDIADRGKADEVKWMIMLFRDDKSLIKSGNKTEKEGLSNRLQNFLEQEYTEVSKSESIDQEWLSAIEDVAKQLGVKLKPEDEKKDANQKDSKLNQ